MISFPRPAEATIIVVLYLLVVRRLRYRRREEIKQRHGMLRRSDYAGMTADQAQAIMAELVEMEFPKLMGISIVFALFKTYGIPRVSSLLATTGELSSQETASKRTADTGVLLLEFCLNKPSSERATEAVARMNYLHSSYLKSGKISNDDMLYTLGVFALEPLRWVGKYEWRSLSEAEKCASGTFWKALGDKMNIQYSPLQSHKAGWTDGLHWLEEIQVWCGKYEAIHMAPSESNRKLALSHLDVIFVNLPQRLSLAGKFIVSVMVGERLRKAMMLPVPPWYYYVVIEYGFLLRKLFLQHLVFPRFELARKNYISAQPERNGRYSAKEYLSHPWYVTPTFQRRWGPRAWMTRLLGRKLPGDDGNKYLPEGYRLAEVGPLRLATAGAKDMAADLIRIRSRSPGGCPFGTRSA